MTVTTDEVDELDVADLFLGTWRGPSTLVLRGGRLESHRAARATDTGLRCVEGLVDASVGAGGYRSSLVDSMLDAPNAILRCLSEHGTRAIRVATASWEELWTLRELAADTGLGLIGGGAALSDQQPTSERVRWIRGEAELRRAIQLSALEECCWVNVQSGSADFVSRVCSLAQRSKLRVALQGPVTVADHLHSGDLFLGLINAVRRSTAESPLELLRRWADSSAGSEAMALLHRLAGGGVGITSELLSFRRGVFVREGLRAPFLEQLEPILPHSRYVREMRNTGGYLAGKQALRRHAGLVEPSRREAMAAGEGWNRLLEFTASAVALTPVLPASRAPQLTLVPGYALKEELAALCHAGLELATVLSLATTRAAEFLGITSPLGPVLYSTWSTADAPGFLTSLAPRRAATAP